MVLENWIFMYNQIPIVLYQNELEMPQVVCLILILNEIPLYC
jgi:hypothetical protein